MGSGTPLRDLDLGTLGVAIEYSTAAPEPPGGGGGCPDVATTGSSTVFLSLS